MPIVDVIIGEMALLSSNACNEKKQIDSEIGKTTDKHRNSSEKNIQVNYEILIRIENEETKTVLSAVKEKKQWKITQKTKKNKKHKMEFLKRIICQTKVTNRNQIIYWWS